MGLDISPGNFSMSYGGFHQFRVLIAEAEGIDLMKMSGFGDPGYGWTVDDEPITVLEPFLHHSDCEGFITGWECEEMLPRLREIIESLDDAYKTRGLLLIEAMEHCADHGCAMVFH